jgi:hypothetical protein
MITRPFSDDRRVQAGVNQVRPVLMNDTTVLPGELMRLVKMLGNLAVDGSFGDGS